MANFSELNDGERKLLKSTRFATIYRIKTYAIKSIPRDFVIEPHNPNFELAILLKLSHKNEHHIIDLLDSRTSNDDLELLFPLYQMDLHDYMRLNYKTSINPYYKLSLETEANINFRNRFNVNKYGLDFTQQLAKALQFLHSNDIIHRDIKPQNILVQQQGDLIRLVITDFGISYDSKNLNQLKVEPKDNKITDVCTSVYKAPELLFGVKNYSSAIDIWALMVLMSQWFQRSTRNPSVCMPALFDDGSCALGDGESGSDIKLILSIFNCCGIPSIEEWPEVHEFGSSDAFCGMFGSSGDDKYLSNQPQDSKLRIINELFPRIEEISTIEKRMALINCILGMIVFESTGRWTSDRILQELTVLI